MDLAMNVADPVFKGEADEVEVTMKAELDYRKFIHGGHKNRVWSNSFCRSVSTMFLSKTKIILIFSSGILMNMAITL